MAANANSDSHDGYYLLGLVMPPAEYAALPLNPQPFALAPHPGELPANAQAAAFSRWKFLYELHLKDVAAASELRTAILASVDQSSRDSITNATTGTRHLSTGDIVSAWHTLYGTLTRADVEALNAARSEPYTPPASLRDFITTHEHSFEAAEANGYNIAVYDRVRGLIQALTPCNLYDQAFQRYFEDNPTVQSQTWERLTTRLLAFEDNRPATATAASHGYANAALLSTAPLPQLDAIIAAAVQSAVQPLTQQIASLQSNRRNLPSSAAAQPGWVQHYCWTHGPTRVRTGKPVHNSASCRNPATGHQVKATATNRMGGRS